MSRITAAAIVAAGAWLGSSATAHAICAIPTAGYLGGLFGTSAVTTIGCLGNTMTAGGAGIISAMLPLANGMSATADLASGVLTAYSANSFASAAEWDTFTFSGLPAGGATVTATLSLAGSTLTGLGIGSAELVAGAVGAGFPGPNARFQTAFGNADTGLDLPASITVSFLADDMTPITVLAEIEAEGVNGNGIADFADPPTLSLALPPGGTAKTASGVFDGFSKTPSIPEPGSLAILLAGLGLLGRARRRTVVRMT